VKKIKWGTLIVRTVIFLGVCLILAMGFIWKVAGFSLGGEEE
jgi:hypothetical protein